MTAQHKRPSSWRLFGLLVAISSTGCVDVPQPQTNPECFHGDQDTCVGADGCTGIRQCKSSGTWGSCSCASTAMVTLGGACAEDSDCSTGAFCLLPDSTGWLGGGPPTGICVADCTDDVTICDAFANGTCVAAERSGVGVPNALCMPKCDLSDGTAASMVCRTTPSSACEPLDATSEGFCRPFCQFDGDCPSGHCDRQVGVCLADAPAQQPLTFGSNCDPSSPTCDGVCLQLGTNASICSNRCVFGTATECAVDGASPLAGVCAYPASEANPGNLGYCTPLCDCNSDCVASGFVCDAFSSTATASILSHKGMCVPAIDSTGSARAGLTCGS